VPLFGGTEIMTDTTHSHTLQDITSQATTLNWMVNDPAYYTLPTCSRGALLSTAAVSSGGQTGNSFITPCFKWLWRLQCHIQF